MEIVLSVHFEFHWYIETIKYNGRLGSNDVLLMNTAWNCGQWENERICIWVLMKRTLASWSVMNSIYNLWLGIIQTTECIFPIEKNFTLPEKKFESSQMEK